MSLFSAVTPLDMIWGEQINEKPKTSSKGGSEIIKKNSCLISCTFWAFNIENVEIIVTKIEVKEMLFKFECSC